MPGRGWERGRFNRSVRDVGRSFARRRDLLASQATGDRAEGSSDHHPDWPKDGSDHRASRTRAQGSHSDAYGVRSGFAGDGVAVGGIIRRHNRLNAGSRRVSSGFRFEITKSG